MKKYYLIIFGLFFLFNVSGQTYGNEWINFSQKYYTFPVYQDGLYKIDYNTLTANNIPINGINPAEFQLFGKDREIPLIMVDGGDNSFDSGDYFLFYAEKNNGWADSLLYPNPATMANPSVSLINDTIYYFFTWKTSGNGLRFNIQGNQNYNAFTPENFVIQNYKSAFNQGYAEGRMYDKASGSIYAAGEGYCYAELVADANNVYYDIPVPTPYLYSGGPDAIVHFRASSNSAMLNPLVQDHHIRVGIGSSNLNLVDTVYKGYKQTIRTKSIPASALTTGYTNVRHEIIWDLGPDVLVDRQAMTYITLDYPRQPISIGNLDQFSVNNSGNGFSRVDFSNYSGTQPIVLSFGAQSLYQYPNYTGSLHQFLIPDNPSGNSTKVVVADAGNTININTLAPVNGTGMFTNFSTQNLEEALLFITHSSLQSSTNDYRSYRSSAAGGGYHIVEGKIAELYLQFGGGIPLNPLGVRRFTHFVYNSATVKPVGLFLIGKGIDALSTRNTPSLHPSCFIPPLGYPASDNAITSGLNGNLWDPLIPTGRISISTDAELSSYLQKVTEYEAKQENNISNFETVKDYQKQILHFVGGATAAQQTSFQNYMNIMKGIAEDTIYAGNVTSYFKTSSNPLDPNVVAGVTQKIEDGVTLMTFLSHAAASNNGFEINIDEPSNWNNAGKYPMVIGLSCYNGNIFSDGISTSEKFVNTVNEGAIGFLSTISVGYDGPLADYCKEFYRQFSYKNYGKTISEQIQHTIQYMASSYGIIVDDYVVLYEAACSQMTLNGDPMLKLNFSTGPEIDIHPQDLSLTPSNVNLSTDSVALTFTIRNLGTSIKTPINVEIRRDFPGSNIDSVYTLSIPRLNYDTIISKNFPLQAQISAGLNTFTVSVDIPSIYTEQFEEIQNNTAKADFFLNIDGMLPIWPYNYAVVPYDTVTVKASTINPIASLNTYLFELDTTDTYDSPQLRRFSVSELGGVKSVRHDQWLSSSGTPFPLICTDSTVYFWRVAVDSTTPNWSEFSFQYIPGKRGWGQDHFFQFKNNSFSGIIYDRSTRTRLFNSGTQHHIYAYAYDFISYYNQWGLDYSYFDYANIFYGAPAIYVGILNPVTLEPWGTHYGSENTNHSFGNGNDNGANGAHPRVEYYFGFDQSDPAQLAAFENLIENEIPPGYYVTIYTTPATLYSNWNTYQPSLYSMFNSIGSTLVNSSQPEKPFAMIFRKGDPSSMVEKHFPDTTGNVLIVDKLITEVEYAGIEKTPIIGPSFKWETLYWKRDSMEMVSVDSVRLKVECLDINLILQIIIDTSFTPNDSIINLNTIVDANLYPYIRLNIFNQDSSFFTPAQIDRLHVLYSPVPEAAIDGSSGYYTSNSDTIYEGQPFSFAVDVVNVSDYDMDSLLVNYWLEDHYHVQHVIPYPRQDSLRTHEVLRDTITFQSVGEAGYNILWMEVNPYINGSTVITDQLEQYHYNNLLQLPVYVVKDDENPILDVTFNGKHILNNDIINPNSEILITLKDDNPYLVMNDVSDTTLFGIYLTGPDGVQKRIPFIDAQGNTIMQWIPANNQDLKFKIIYPKEFLVDGTYQLLVQGTDRSGNVSGDYEYKVNFEVVRESSITNMMNYPNPFSTSTRFVFTLTGTQEPDDIIIRIMTVSGRVVREITEDELGRIVIGRNITEYAWDGKDEFGDPLANGVYLYEVKARINGEDIKHRDSGADQYFKKNFGKMYLMR